MRRRRTTRLKRAANRRVLARCRVSCAVDVSVAEADGGAVQRRPEKRVRTVEVQDGVAAGDVEGKALVELDSLVGEIGGDAGVTGEARRPDHEPLDLRSDG